MTRVALGLLIAVWSLFAAAVAEAHECEFSCSSRCVVLMDDYQRIIDANRDYCGSGSPDCVRNCTARYASGECRTYGPDYCERDAVCVPNCTARYASGECRTYAADHCGRAPQNCVARCTDRYASGECRTYGADICGRNPWCQPNCTDRYSSGECRTYGPDQCGMTEE